MVPPILFLRRSFFQEELGSGTAAPRDVQGNGRAQAVGTGGSCSKNSGKGGLCATEVWWETQAGSAVAMPQHLCKSAPAAAQGLR